MAGQVLTADIHHGPQPPAGFREFRRQVRQGDGPAEDLIPRQLSAIRRDITAGTYAAGDALPTEAQLCETFNASRGSIRQAMATLRGEGLVTSAQDRRSVVIDRADSALAAALDIPVLTQVLVIKWLQLMDGEPALVERFRYRMEFGRHVLGFDPDSGSIHHHLMNHGVEIHRASRTIAAIAADADDTELLKVAVGSPLLRVRRRAFTHEGIPAEASDDRYLPNRANFALHSMRGSLSPLTMIPGD